MFRHLKLIDGSSDKFWQIETNGNSHTVTYGRNGTDGQSKTKNFDSAESCLKDAEKLIAEKIKKGYSDDGLAIVAPSEKKVGGQSKQVIADEYLELIRQTNIDGLLPFLERHLKGNVEFIKKEIRKAKKYWLTWTDLSKEPEFKHRSNHNWGQRGDRAQQRLIALSALATFSLSDTTTWTELIDLLNSPKDPAVKKVLDWAKPNWLADYAAEQLVKNEWMAITYDNIRLLEEWGYFEFKPEVYARSLGNVPNLGYNEPEKKVYLDRLIEDEKAYTRDVPLLLAYETNLQNNHLHYDYQTQESELVWDYVFPRLLEQGKLDTDLFIQQLFETQTKDWNINLKSFFRKLLTKLNIDDEVILHHQNHLFPLLHHEQAAVVNFAIDRLKPLIGRSELDSTELLSWLEPVFMRSDLKGGIKTLLIQFDKWLKQERELASPVCSAITPVFMLSDLSLQERAAKLIAKYAAVEDEEIKMRLTMYATQPMGDVSTLLNPWMEEAPLSEAEVLSPLRGMDEAYKYEAPKGNDIQLDQPITYLANWSDILFHWGKIIKGGDPLDMELLIHAWLTKQDEFPADYIKQLDPYLKQLKSGYNETSYASLFGNVLLNIIYQPKTIYRYKSRYNSEFRSISILDHLLALFQGRLQQHIAVSLLSTPSHAPYWVSPEVLIDRIIAHEQQGIAIDPVDMAIAISRMPRIPGADNKAQLQHIQTDILRELLGFALGYTEQIKVEEGKNWLQRLFKKEGGEKEWQAVWATTARTRWPEGKFSAFETGALAGFPFVVEPYRPGYQIKPNYNTNYDYRTKQNEQYLVGQELTFPMPAYQDTPTPLLYAMDVYATRKNEYFYYVSDADIRYFFSLTPQVAEPLSLVLNYRFNSYSLETSKTIPALLTALLDYHGATDPSTQLFIACSLLTKEKNTRTLAAELVLQWVEKGKLDVQTLGEYLGDLIGGAYAPINRFLDLFEVVRDISPVHNDALYQLLKNLLLRVSWETKMPANFKKLIEQTYDLALRLGKKDDKQLMEKIAEWEKVAALKPIVLKLKKL